MSTPAYILRNIIAVNDMKDRVNNYLIKNDVFLPYMQLLDLCYQIADNQDCIRHATYCCTYQTGCCVKTSNKTYFTGKRGTQHE